MARAKFSAILYAALFFAGATPALAQLSPSEPDPLARIRDAAKTNVQACSATGETLCEQVAPKIIANAEEESPLPGNVRRLARGLEAETTAARENAVNWAVETFRAAGVEVRVEENNIPAAASKSGGQVQRAIVAEIRGREKPEEWVLLGARVALPPNGRIRAACNAALVVEAARDIQLTGIHPRRSIRFVILVDSDENMPGFWAYARAHRDELEGARAAIFFVGGADPTNAYMLRGRQDIETGLREAMKPIESWRVDYDVFGASIFTGDFDFLLEGIPTIVAHQHRMYNPDQAGSNFSEDLNEADIQEVKRSTATAAVTAFGIAERSEPIGPRQSRAEIESLLNTTIIGKQLKAKGLWYLWESGERGRLP